MTHAPTIYAHIHWATSQLPFDTARLDAEVLLGYLLDCSRAYLIANPDDELTQAQSERYQKLVRKHATGYPLAYIVGKKEFWSQDFNVSPDVLIPRPDTETLIEVCLQQLDKEKQLTVADFGTGSGAIACSLALECFAWQVVAIDNSEEALKIAKQNAVRLNLDNVKFILSDWGSELHEKFDAIVSNPPYLTIDDEFAEDALEFEPQNALVAGPTGLECIEKIIQQSVTLLNPNGMLAFEHGFNQAEKVRALLSKAGFKNVSTHQDLSGHDRVSLGFLSS